MNKSINIYNLRRKYLKLALEPPTQYIFHKTQYVETLEKNI